MSDSLDILVSLRNIAFQQAAVRVGKSLRTCSRAEGCLSSKENDLQRIVTRRKQVIGGLHQGGSARLLANLWGYDLYLSDEIARIRAEAEQAKKDLAARYNDLSDHRKLLTREQARIRIAEKLRSKRRRVALLHSEHRQEEESTEAWCACR